MEYLNEEHERIEKIHKIVDDCMVMLPSITISGQQNWFLAFKTLEGLQQINSMIDAYEASIEEEYKKKQSEKIEIDNTKKKEDK